MTPSEELKLFQIINDIIQERNSFVMNFNIYLMCVCVDVCVDVCVVDVCVCVQV